MKDKEKFKDRLLDYLTAKGHNVSQSPCRCINPDHDDIKKPSMVIGPTNFKCMGSCAIEGDVYDAAGILIKSNNFNEQFEEVEKTLTGYISENKKAPEIKKTPIDKEIAKKVEIFMAKHPGRHPAVLRFLKERGYPEKIQKELIKYYAYWPGLDEAKKEFSLEDLEKAGVYDSNKDYHAWYYSGVVCRLASGWKLMYYKNDKNDNNKRKCEKRNSLQAKIFPSPYTEEELKGTVFIVEAETSAISMRVSGFPNTFASGSVNGITRENAQLLKKCKTIIFLFDGDNAGYFHSGLESVLRDKKTGEPKKRAIPAYKKIFQAGFNGTMYAGRLPENRDPDDFMQQGKIDELKKIIDAAIEIKPGKKPDEPEEENKDEKENPPFRFLGFDEKHYYILPKNQNIPYQIARGERSIKDKMFEIAPKTWWSKNFYIESERNGEVTTQFAQAKATQWFREESFKIGIYDDSRIKGSGVFFDQNQFIINTGDGLKINNKKLIPYEKWKGHNFYIRSRRKFDITGKKWTAADSLYLWQQLNTFSYEKKIDPIAVLGYIGISPFSGILDRRPCIWLTGGAGTGKSFLIDELISPGIGGELYALLTEGLSTEAYIRQSLKKDAIPVVIDELEADNKNDKMTVESVIRLNRSSYGGKIAGRGSTGDKPVDYRLKSMFCFASVNVLISNQADEGRIHVVRMKPHNGFCKPPRDFSGLRARTFSRLPKIMEDIKRCKEIILERGLPNRTADTYSPFLATSWNILFDEPFLEGPKNKIITQFYEAIMELSNTEINSDEEKIIYRILQQKIRIDAQEELSIAEMLTLRPGDKASGDEINFNNVMQKNGEIVHKERIQRIGIKRYNLKDENDTEVMAIASNHPMLKDLLKDTPFQNYKEIIRRNDAVIHKTKKVRIAGVVVNAIVFDWDKFYKKYLAEDSNPVDDEPF